MSLVLVDSNLLLDVVIDDPALGGGVCRSPLRDFYIGAHAAVGGYRLLTRNEGR